jgi:hypothetical protein
MENGFFRSLSEWQLIRGQANREICPLLLTGVLDPPELGCDQPGATTL